MPCCTSGDGMAPGCGRTGGSPEARRNRRVGGSATGNSPVTTRGRGAGEDLGEDGPNRWVPASGDRGARNGNGPAHAQDWAERHCSDGPARRKRPDTPFSI
jgi:hypothetical protein